MKMFARIKTYEEIVHQCACPVQEGMLPRRQIPLNDNLYLTRGYDTIVVGDQVDRRYGYAIYNLLNGRFFGVTPMHPSFTGPIGTEFSSDDTLFEDEPWFEALLDFFYVREDAVDITVRARPGEDLRSLTPAQLVARANTA